MIARRRPVVRINRPLEEAPGPPAHRRAARRIGLLGGSFNPAHEGHRAISLDALKRLRLHQVWWLVSPQNPLKPTADMADLESRLASARAVVAGHPRLIVTDLEQRLGKRFTVDTVRWLKDRRRERFVWLIGADNLAQLPRWRAWQRIVELVPIAVFDREPYSYRALAGRMARRYASRRRTQREAGELAECHPPAWVYMRLRRHGESSTEIRRQRRRRRRAEQEKKPS